MHTNLSLCTNEVSNCKIVSSLISLSLKGLHRQFMLGQTMAIVWDIISFHVPIGGIYFVF
jgi:TM2 domain-containing membrane protein YozV